MPEKPRILFPIRVLEDESIPSGVPQLLANAHVVLLGYHVIPEQTATGQARMQFEERASARMDEFEEMLADTGATVERRLVFTHHAQTTIDRMIYEHECLAVLVPDAVQSIDEVLVPVRGTVSVERMARVLGGLFAGTDATLTLFHVLAEGESDDDAQTLFETVGDRLQEFGVEASAIQTEIARDSAPLAAIVDATTEYDVIVMGESDPSLSTFVFGMPTEQVAAQFLGPVLVVQRERPEQSE